MKITEFFSHLNDQFIYSCLLTTQKKVINVTYINTRKYV